MNRPVRDVIWVEISIKKITPRPVRDAMWVENTLAKLMSRPARDGMYAGYGNVFYHLISFYLQVVPKGTGNGRFCLTLFAKAITNTVSY